MPHFDLLINKSDWASFCLIPIYLPLRTAAVGGDTGKS